MTMILRPAFVLASLALASGLHAADTRAQSPRATPASHPVPPLAAASAPRYSPPSNSPPDLVLTGIVELFATKRAFLLRSQHGQPLGTYTLKEGETRDGLEVLAIDARAETVSVRNAGVAMTLTLKSHGPATVERQLFAERQMVQEHVLAHERREQSEQIRIARERAEAEQFLLEQATPADPPSEKPLSPK